MSIKSQQVLIMASGNGSNFEAIYSACKNNELNAEVMAVVSDNAEAFVLERAKAHGLASQCIDFKSYDKRSVFNQALLDACKQWKPDFIVLAGFMRILCSDIVNAFPRKIINIHPSLLPLYPGTQSIKKSLAHKDAFTGVTVHYVDEGMDTGDIIEQESLEIDSKDNLESLSARVHALEHQLYVRALKKIFDENMKL